MLCSVCLKNEVPPNNEDMNYCLDCHFSGRRFEMFLLSEERSNVLGRIRETEGVSTASVWHVGNGRFNLGVILNDGTIVSPGVAMPVGDMLTVQPAIPPIGTDWGIMVARPSGHNSVAAAIMQETFDDDQLVEEVEKIASGEREFDLAPNLADSLGEDMDELISEAVSDTLDATWITSTGQIIAYTHSPERCEGEGCVVHHPSDHPLKEWPTQFVPGSLIEVPKHSERVCEHGVGHPDPDDIVFFKKNGIDITIGHELECDGCCSIAND